MSGFLPFLGDSDFTSVENRLGGDMYDPEKGRTRRSLDESIFDTLFGQRDAIQKAGEEDYIKQLQNSDDAKYLRNVVGQEVDYREGGKPISKSDLEDRAYSFREKERTVNAILNTNNPDLPTKAELFATPLTKLRLLINAGPWSVQKVTIWPG